MSNLSQNREIKQDVQDDADDSFGSSSSNDYDDPPVSKEPKVGHRVQFMHDVVEHSDSFASDNSNEVPSENSFDLAASVQNSEAGPSMASHRDMPHNVPQENQYLSITDKMMMKNNASRNSSQYSATVRENTDNRV